MNLYGFGMEADPARWSRQEIGENNVVKGLRRMSELSRQHGFSPLIAIWPNFTDTSVVDANFMPGGDQLVIERLGRMFRIPTVRLSHDFLRDISAQQSSVNPRLRYTIDDGMHPSAEGCRVAALALKEHLTQHRDGAINTKVVNNDVEIAEDADAVAAAAVLGGKVPSKGREFSDIGSELVASGKFEQAIEWFKLAVDLDNGDALAHLNWGNALQGPQHFEEAVSHYQEALRIKPNFPEAHSNLGNALLGLGRIDETVAHYQEALRLKPNDHAAHTNLGVLLARLGRIDEAVAHYQEALRIKPNDPVPHNNLGNTLVRLGQLQKAAEHFQEALRLKPDFTAARENLRSTETLLQQKNGSSQ